MKGGRLPLQFAHAGDFHLDEDRYFADTAQCLEWFVADAIQSSVDLFVINGDLTTYKATIKERNLWVNSTLLPIPPRNGRHNKLPRPSRGTLLHATCCMIAIRSVAVRFAGECEAWARGKSGRPRGRLGKIPTRSG
jgi:hypothetical protein